MFKNTEFESLVTENFMFLVTNLNYQRIIPPQFITEIWKDIKMICYNKLDLYILMMKDDRERFLSIITIKCSKNEVPLIGSNEYKPLINIIVNNGLDYNLDKIHNYNIYSLREVILYSSEVLKEIIENKIDIYSQ